MVLHVCNILSLLVVPVWVIYRKYEFIGPGTYVKRT